jgi:DNA helicase-2/ATP-dependent DNA helicase PcrA
MTELRSKLELPPHEVIQHVLDQSGYRKMLQETPNDEDAERLANIEELITAAKQFHDEDPTRNLTDFLENITLASDVDSWNTESDCVSVMTLHSAKGLEFPVAYILAVEQGLIPHERSLAKDDELEEERRLLFVGITRAMKELNLCHARLRDFRGQSLYAVPSMFLDELPKEVEHHDLSASRAMYRSYSKPTPLQPVPPPASPSPTSSTSGNTGTGTNSPSDYAVGQLVQHSEYGIGHIVDVNGFGALRRIKIRFAASGEKTFVAEKVKLRIVPKKS